MGGMLLSDRVGGGMMVFAMVLLVYKKSWAWDWVVGAGEVIYERSPLIANRMEALNMNGHTLDSAVLHRATCLHIHTCTYTHTGDTTSLQCCPLM